MLLLLSGCLSTGLSAQPNQSMEIDLSGMWRFQLDPMGFGKTPGSELFLHKLAETIGLPGSTDQGGKGIKNTARYVDRLSRQFEYQGAAWYQREVVIPTAWAGREITLELERCHWETTLYVDGKLVGVEERLSTPNRFRMTEQLAPGIHTLTLCVDNRLKYPMDQWAHGTTEYTQTNWNGVVGRIALYARERAQIRQVKVSTDVAKEQVEVAVALSPLRTATVGRLGLKIRERGSNRVIVDRTIEVDSLLATSVVCQTLSMGKEMKCWDEFSPNLYELDVVWQAEGMQESRTVVYGMRSVAQGKHHILLNGRKIHLRGVLDCAVFPLTGYPSVAVADWKRIFSTVKEYGMNHVRFHSWCPPKAAFVAADELGLYLQVELPMWVKDVGQHPARNAFFEREMYAILDEYGNHPSFILMCNGNENEGDSAVLEALVKKGQAYDSRRLYSASTARVHTASDQYYVSHVTHKGRITTYEGKPATDWDLSQSSDIDVPVIAHETGQRCMYPNFNEMKKYTGVLEPRNFERFRETLTKSGMLHQADDFFRATGAHTVLQYKEVNESLLRTRNSGGFQLLGLADFPGQGSAFVGILDAFWESKGLVTPERFRESCAPTVLLARLPKRTYRAGERFRTQLELYHYGEQTIKGQRLNWVLVHESGVTYRHGSYSVQPIQPGQVKSLGEIELPLEQIDTACRLTLKVELAGVKNEWDIWVYPQPAVTSHADFLYTRSWNEEAKKWLHEGGNVLLIPEKAAGRQARFAGHFWNPIMFNWDPLIVGTLIRSKHPAFRHFPTSEYADWQWFDVLNNATAMELDELKEITPLIQSIDSYETNRKLGIAFEAKVSNGNLFVLCVDPEREIDQRLATQQLLVSVKQYVASADFLPERTLPLYRIDALFSPRVPQKGDANQVNQAILQLLNQ